ncbi:septum formation inhibitor Maf [Christiangramia aquimixticola]|uniref:septum formation inhibitor Maf n=1 Tax=Christiangramia aquimixticola TaxID=1697558 RepID=UPI003AA8E779
MIRQFSLIAVLLLFSSCSEMMNRQPELVLTDEFKDYWYSGKAEITSYHLEQARYGEIREGEAVLIYVTEDLLPDQQVKANSITSGGISSLKLNSTKKFLTGIYPYSIMQSSFYPLDGKPHAIKVSASIQEWCGQTYMQLNNRGDFDIVTHSYFEGEADTYIKINKVNLENEIWNRLRVQYSDLPVGNFKMIPSFEYLRLTHQKVEPHIATGEYYTNNHLNVYELNYPDLKRNLKIYFDRSFPYSVEKWEETYPSGTGNDAITLTTRAVKKQLLRTDYWNRNSNKDLPLRNKLDLD